MSRRILSSLVVAAVTVAAPATAGAVTISSSQTITGVNYGTQQVVVNNGATVTFDGVTFGAFGATANSFEGRLQVTGNSNVIVKNSHFGPGGCSDGLNTAGAGTVTIQNTEFTGIKQGSCSPVHVDPVQPYGAASVTVTDSYFHGNSTGIMDPDCNGGKFTFRNNVFVTDGEYPDQIVVAGGSGDIFEHNVFASGARIRFGNPNGCGLNSNATVRNNVISGGLSLTNGQSTSSFTMAQNPASVTFAAGTGRCGYATASPKGTGSDGTDIGLNDCGATQPPPPPPSDTTAPDTTITSAPANPTTSTSASFSVTATESGSTLACKLDAGAYGACTSPKAYSALSAASHTFSVRATDAAGNTDASPATKTWTVQTSTTPPPTDHQPVAAFTNTPTAPTAGQAVTFDASSTTCVDAPCTYTWVDDGTDGPAGQQWPLGTGKTMSFTFQGTGVKNVRLNVTDVDGDTATTMKAINVAAAGSTPPPADTTAPNTTITSGPTGTTTDNTPTFAFTASESASKFQCQLDSGAWTACTTPWTTSALTDGMHGIAVRATDAAGNTDATPATQSFTVAAAAAPQTLVGSSTLQSGSNSNTAGTAEAFRTTASASGSTRSMSVYVASNNTAGAVVLGIYSDANGHPGTLLTKGTKTGLAAGAWNTVSVSAASVTSAKTYWVAVLGTGGTLQFRGGSASGCRSEGSGSSTLTTLPATWQTGASWGSCAPSAYATS